MDNRLYLIDVSNLFHRAFWGNDPLTTSTGQSVQGLYGITKMIHAIVRDFKPTHIVAAMEGGELLRKNISPDYKGNRSEPNEDLVNQMKLLPELMAGMGIKTVSVKGYEADDVIGTFAYRGMVKPEINEIKIVSGDKDFSQLILLDKIKILDLGKGLEVGGAEIHAKYGLKPDQFVDYLAIVGDSGDNVKGVEGIGPKGATKLLTEFYTLDNIYANLDKIKGANKDKLIASADRVKIAKQLVTIDTNTPVDVTIEDLAYKGVNTEKLSELFVKLEFRSLMAEILGMEANVGPQIGVRR